MKKFFQVVFWTFWLTIGLIFNGALFMSFNEKDIFEVMIVFTGIWWGITIIIALIKWIIYRKENPKMSKETKEFYKKMQYEKTKEYKEKYCTEIEISHNFFGKGILLKDNEKELYTEIKSGFDVLFNYLKKKEEKSYDIFEFLVKPDNLNNVLNSMEKIYIDFNKTLEGFYDTIYNEIIKFYENNTQLLNKDFSLQYLKENWYVIGMQIEDDVFNVFLGVDAGNNHEFDSNYEIEVIFDLQNQSADLSFNVVW